MKEKADGWWHEGIPEWMRDMFGEDSPWLFWLPEVMREIADSTHCAMPAALPAETDSLEAKVNAWGPILPLFHFHRGWPRIDVGLLNWARAGFDTMNDPTLRVVARHWGPALPTVALWSFERSGAPDHVSPPLALISALRTQARSFAGAGPAGLHLENHWSLLSYGHWASAYHPERWGTDRPTELVIEKRQVAPGVMQLILPTYANWYGALEEVGQRLSPLPSGRSWRVDLTIAPIGYIGQFRRSRVSGRWFAGRHRAHQLGVPSALLPVQ